MMTPQLTEQYGQVERVSVVRAIFSSRTAAYAGARSKPSTDTAVPPRVVSLRKSRRVGCMRGSLPYGVTVVEPVSTIHRQVGREGAFAPERGFASRKNAAPA